jgi:hypothetical protein
MELPTMNRLFAMLFAAVFGTAHATEEPAYRVIHQLDGAEVRLYAPYVVAEVEVAGPAEDAGSAAFPILASYIFGKNKGEKKLEMTSPVSQAAAPVKLEMTAPVTQAATAGGFLVQFVLPSGVTLATAPEPLDARVRLREVPARRGAVIRYSGFWTQSNYQEHLEKLQATLRSANIEWAGEPVLSRYDPPFKPWFLRRNEIWLSLNNFSKEVM